MQHCIAMMEKIDEKFPNEYCYYLFADATLTGNFEMTLHSEQPGPDIDMDKDIQIHSKKACGKFPMDDIETFFGLLEASVDEL